MYIAVKVLYKGINRRRYTMENTYWANKGKYQTDYDRLANLMPAIGDADTVAGEMIRSISRLGHELYNNGMGNNSSGAVNFLLNHDCIDATTHEIIYPFTRGRLYEGNYNGDTFQKAVESAIDQTLFHILQNPGLETELNTESMFDAEEEEQRFCEECEDELDQFDGHICNSCEDHMWFSDEEEEDY